MNKSPNLRVAPHHVQFLRHLVDSGLAEVVLASEVRLRPELVAAFLGDPVSSMGLSEPAARVLAFLAERPTFAGSFHPMTVRSLVQRGLVEEFQTQVAAVVSAASGREVSVGGPVRMLRLTDAGRGLL